MSIDNGAVELRPFTMKDADATYWAALRDPAVNRYLDSRPWSYTEAGLVKRLGDLQAGAGWMFSIRRVFLQGGIGTCTIRYEGEPWHGTAVFGLMLFPQYHGQGYGTGTIREATRMAFETFYLRKLWAGVHGGNVPSSRAFAAAGWKHEGTFGQHRREDWGSAVLDVDVQIWSAWRETWLQARATAPLVEYGPKS